MFDEHEDCEEEPLGMVIEEEEDSGEEEDSDTGQNEEKELKAREKEEIRNLKTQLMTMREKLQDKSARIDKIKDTLAISAVTYNFDQVQENAATEEELLDSSRDDVLSSDATSDERLDDAEGASPHYVQVDPQITKLQDKVKLLRHRCIGSLGNLIFDQAMDTLQELSEQSTDQKRQALIKVLGEDSIGFWAVMDQIVFYEGLVTELSTQEASSSGQ